MTAVAVWLAVCAVASAQAGKPLTAKQRFDAAAAKEDAVRLVLTNATDGTPAKSLATRVSQVVTSFETLVRRFPTSGYADDALWRAASLADESYQRLNRQEDRDKALKMYRWLVQEYPTSTFVKQANSKIAAINVSDVVTDSPSTSEADVAPAPERATLTSIQRAVLPDAVRVTIELDREVTYKEDRIGGPARLFFDLKNVDVTAALKDKVLTYGSDVVSKIRVGRHPDNVVRVVLDFEDVRRYSVFTLYSPFRLVIDAERNVAAAAAPPMAVAPARAETASVAIPAPAPPPKPKPTLIDEPVPAAPVPETPMPATASPPPPIEARPTAPAANAAGGFSIARQLGLSVSRIVIDPGHGGHDPGTPARGLTESQLTLDVALRLEKLLAKDEGVEVVLTRRTDAYIPLEERTAIANRSDADLFLSIHANSSRNTAASGIETYFLSFASSPDAEAIAARENSASEREMHQLSDIIKAISLNNKLDESRDLANMVQDALMANLKKSNREVRSRGVKKAPFVVLIGAQMPSVLAEISFLTNRRELQLLKTAAYKQRIAESLHNAIVKYRKSLKGARVATIER
jgi:N-acetylmuramoyl-L-alanine amidase